MPRNTPITFDTEWVQLTDADATEITFQNIGSESMYVTGTNGTGEPAADALGLLYQPGQGEMKVALADLFPGVSGANRLWAKAEYQTTQAFVSHA